MKTDTPICPFQIYSEGHCKVAMYMHLMSESDCLAGVGGAREVVHTKQASDSTPSHILPPYGRLFAAVKIAHSPQARLDGSKRSLKPLDGEDGEEATTISRTATRCRTTQEAPKGGGSPAPTAGEGWPPCSVCILPNLAHAPAVSCCETVKPEAFPGPGPWPCRAAVRSDPGGSSSLQPPGHYIGGFG